MPAHPRQRDRTPRPGHAQRLAHGGAIERLVWRMLPSRPECGSSGELQGLGGLACAPSSSGNSVTRLSPSIMAALRAPGLAVQAGPPASQPRREHEPYPFDPALSRRRSQGRRCDRGGRLSVRKPCLPLRALTEQCLVPARLLASMWNYGAPTRGLLFHRRTYWLTLGSLRTSGVPARVRHGHRAGLRRCPPCGPAGQSRAEPKVQPRGIVVCHLR